MYNYWNSCHHQRLNNFDGLSNLVNSHHYAGMSTWFFSTQRCHDDPFCACLLAGTSPRLKGCNRSQISFWRPDLFLYVSGILQATQWRRHTRSFDLAVPRRTYEVVNVCLFYRHINNFIAYSFYRATRMHSADYAVARCLAVRLSVCETPVFSRHRWTNILNFLPPHSPTILVFFVPNGMAILWREAHNGAVECKGVWKITIFDQYLASSRKW